MYRYFTYREFDSPDDPGSGELMDPTFLEMLDRARELYGAPIIVNSGYRTPYWNEMLKKKGYVVAKNSSHLLGHAADLHCANDQDRYALLMALDQAGFNRFGIGGTFIHVDNDPDKNPYRLWRY